MLRGSALLNFLLFPVVRLRVGPGPALFLSATWFLGLVVVVAEPPLPSRSSTFHSTSYWDVFLIRCCGGREEEGRG